MDNLAVNRRYDFLRPPEKDWGLYVMGVGTRIAPPRVPYQVHEAGAPYQWHKGRVLSDYGLVYLTRGGGSFRTHTIRRLSVQAGDMLLLSPGVWHNYVPDPQVGWHEYWVVFNGRLAVFLARQLERASSAPVLRPGLAEPLRRLFHEMLDVAHDTPSYHHVILGGLLLVLIARTQSCIQTLGQQGRKSHAAVEQAKQQLQAQLSEQPDMRALARRLAMSYRHFRRVFKASTGMAPQHYLLNLRINFAKRLLEEEGASIKEVAQRSGFADQYYFSRLFRQKTGFSPSQWRQ